MSLSELKPHDYQSEAWSTLDELARDSITSSPLKHLRHAAGLVQIPTGGGKTFTAVEWITRFQDKHPGVKVLWIADKQELINQAADEFIASAERLPAEARTRSMRVIHSRASASTHLAQRDLDVICVTRQSLHGREFDAAARRRIKEFARDSRIIVVVDEAHHAVAPTYEKVLDHLIESSSASLLLGLTATPWPSGAGMTQRLKERFPTSVASVDATELMSREVLAQPIVHTRQTHEEITLDEDELRQLNGPGDLPEWLLSRLSTDNRNRLILSTWLKDKRRWGKTLIFVGTIDHANTLGDLFKDAGVPTDIVHSKSDEHYSVVLKKFRRETKPRVLISVAQLLEGVNVPDARTAILARPTRSPILLRQMIGRVLRGPVSGGDPEAHIVDFRDNWRDDLDILSPRELVGISASVAVAGESDTEFVLPPLLDEITQVAIPADIDERIHKYFEGLHRDPLQSDMLHETRLVGYYQLDERSVPVFDHAEDRWRELITDRLKRKHSIHSPIALFGDLPIPRPTKRDVDAVVGHVTNYLGEPPFQPIRLTLSPASVARELLASPAMDEVARRNWIRSHYEASLARHAFPSLEAFQAAVDRQVDKHLSAHSGLDAEAPRASGRKHPKPLPRNTRRSLIVAQQSAMARAKELLASEPLEYLEHLLNGPTLSVEWTRRPVHSTLAYWAPRISGKSRGTSVIRVNVALQTHKSIVSDDALQFLLWHELCHYIRPGFGHDWEFRRLESLWPNAAQLDRELDSVAERYDLGRRL